LKERDILIVFIIRELKNLKREIVTQQVQLGKQSMKNFKRNSGRSQVFI